MLLAAMAPTVAAVQVATFGDATEAEEIEGASGAGSGPSSSSGDSDRDKACVDVIQGGSRSLGVTPILLPGVGVIVWGPMSAGAVVYADNCVAILLEVVPHAPVGHVLGSGDKMPQITLLA